jgi:hypothetical protein
MSQMTRVDIIAQKRVLPYGMKEIHYALKRVSFPRSRTFGPLIFIHRYSDVYWST